MNVIMQRAGERMLETAETWKAWLPRAGLARAQLSATPSRPFAPVIPPHRTSKLWKGEGVHPFPQNPVSQEVTASGDLSPGQGHLLGASF